MKRLCTIAALAATAAACSGDGGLAGSIHDQFKRSGKRSVDLGTAVPGPWQRVCVIGPYMDNAATRKTLGFAWDSEKVSDVAQNEAKVLLVFVDAGDRVAAFVDYRRDRGDFSNLAGQCFARPDAVFEQVSRPLHGWSGLFPKSALPAKDGDWHPVQRTKE